MMTEFSNETKETIAKVEAFLESTGESKFVNLKDGQSVEGFFRIDKMAPKTFEYFDSKTGEKRYSNGVNFEFVQHVEGEMNGRDKILFLKKTWAGKVLEKLKEGHGMLKVSRTGAGMKDTNYNVEALD